MYICWLVVTCWYFSPFLSFLHYPGSPGGCLKASWGLWLGIHKFWAHGEPWGPLLYRKLLEKWPLVALIFLKSHVLGIDFVIDGARKARDPARVVDDVEVCRKNHKFSDNYLRKVPIVKWRARISYQNSLSTQGKNRPADGGAREAAGELFGGVLSK